MDERIKSPTINVERNIIEILDKLQIEYEQFEHAPVFTMAEAENTSGHRPEEGAKTLLLSTEKGQLYLAVLRGDHRLDFSKVKSVLGIKKVSMAKDEDLKSIGVSEGALTPFGYGVQIPVLLDSSVFDQEFTYINPGVNNKTIKMRGKDLGKAIKFWAKEIHEI